MTNREKRPLTNIYGLYDPRNPNVIMYVGKGPRTRSEQHWKKFTATGKVVNALLRRWFESLKADSVIPQWRILEEVAIEGWEAREKFWIAHWRALNPNLCNVADGGNAWPLEASRLGGRIGTQTLHAAKNEEGKSIHAINMGRLGGPMGGRNMQDRYRGTQVYTEWQQRAGRKNAESGHMRRIQRLGASIGGRIGGRNVHKLHPNMAREIAHTRQHTYRGRVNHRCKLCNEEAITNAHLLKPYDVVDFIDRYLSPAPQAGWTDCVEVAA